MEGQAELVGLSGEGVICPAEQGGLQEVFYFQGNNNKGEESWTGAYLEENQVPPIIWTTEHFQEKNLIHLQPSIKPGDYRKLFSLNDRDIIVGGANKGLKFSNGGEITVRNMFNYEVIFH